MASRVEGMAESGQTKRLLHEADCGGEGKVTSELDVLRRVSELLAANGVQFMLTGSFALAYYATPRMTRDLDLVVALEAGDGDRLAAALSAEFYIDPDEVRRAIISQRLFNLMHYGTGIKVDCIVRKTSAYRLTEFARRQKISLAGVDTWIVSREDLILSKLVWAREASSELQLRDARQLLDDSVDMDYLQHWAPGLGVSDALSRLVP